MAARRSGTGSRPGGRRSWAAAPAVLLVVAASTTATYSVVRYRGWIVAVYGALALSLLGVQAFGWQWPPLGRRAAACGLAAAGSATLLVHSYSYLTPDRAGFVRALLGGSALLAAVVLSLPERLLPPSRAADGALAVAVLGYLACAALLIHFDPTPRIDVWVTLQQGTEATFHGRNIYAMTWTGSPGVQDAFTYLPWTAVLVAPGRLLTGDVRWSLVAATLVAAGFMRAVPRRGRTAGAASAAALLLLLPGTPTQVEQSWTEPLLLATLAGWAWAVTRNRPWWGVVPLALGLASKQHLVLLLPLMAAWPRFGVRRTAAAAALAGLLVLPWVVASPGDMLSDTVTLLVHFPPLRFADTAYVAAMHELGWTPPFWVTGAVVVLTVTGAAAVLRRREAGAADVVRWSAAVLLVANLVNKQAFYNQYWLVLALLLLAWALPHAPAEPDHVAGPPQPEREAAAGRPTGSQSIG